MAVPNSSCGPAAPASPSESLVQSWLRVVVRPAGDPYRTCTAPASNFRGPRSSPSTPTARSPNPSPSKSPAACAQPKKPPSSGTSAIPAEAWENLLLPSATSPFADPYRIVTEPASPTPPTSSNGVVTARSDLPSPSKSDATSVDGAAPRAPVRSSGAPAAGREATPTNATAATTAPIRRISASFVRDLGPGWARGGNGRAPA